MKDEDIDHLKTIDILYNGKESIDRAIDDYMSDLEELSGEHNEFMLRLWRHCVEEKVRHVIDLGVGLRIHLGKEEIIEAGELS